MNSKNLKKVFRKTKKNNNNGDNEIPTPRVDPALSDPERFQQRDARLAAAEQRMKQNNPTSTKKKKKTNNTAAPLKGPNSKPLMRWTS